MELSVDLSGLTPRAEDRAPLKIEVGDILKTRQGRLYWVIALPGPSAPWRSSDFLYYLTLNHEGRVVRPGQILHAYAASNWTRVGRCDFQIGKPEWFV